MGHTERKGHHHELADSIREKTARKIESHREEGRVRGLQEVLNQLTAKAQDKPEIMELLRQIANEKDT